MRESKYCHSDKPNLRDCFFQTRKRIANSTPVFMTSATTNLAPSDIFKGCHSRLHWYAEAVEAHLEPGVTPSYEHRTAS